MWNRLGIGGACLALLSCLAVVPAGAAVGHPLDGSFELQIQARHTVDPETVQLVGTMQGNASGIGKFTGWVAYDLNPLTGDFHGEAMKVAANGDELYETVEGQFTSATTATGTYTIDGGTGRFAEAFGDGEFAVSFSSMDQGVVTFDATIDYDASHRAGSVPLDRTAFDLLGQVIFTNIQPALSDPTQLVGYVGVGASRLTGANVQTGTIERTTAILPVDADTLQFEGQVGPHPVLGTRVHVISTGKGDIYCTWTATFTIQFTGGVVDGVPQVVFSGLGNFVVVGGTGHYRRASGHFITDFSTGTILLSADSASASVEQQGSIAR